MLKDLFIIDESGLGLFEFHLQESRLELQLIAGLISALIAFSKSALLDSIQVIHLEHGKLVISAIIEKGLYLVGLYDQNDHDMAIKRANQRIVRDFIRKFPTQSGQMSITDYDPVSALRLKWEFSLVMDKSAKHAIGVSLVSSLFLALIYFTNDLGLNVVHYGTSQIQTYLSLYLLFAIPYFVIGFFIGNKKLGTIFAIILNTIFSTLLVVQLLYQLGIPITQFSLSDISFDGSDLTYGVSMIAGFFGGYVAELYLLNKT